MCDNLSTPPRESEVEVPAWSFSRKSDFERCKFYFKLKHLDRIPEPPRPLKEGQTEQANDRGSRIHAAAEAFVRGTLPELPQELAAFNAEYHWLRRLYSEGRVSCEEDWAFNNTWDPCAWSGPDAWLRMKLDALVQYGEEAVVIDYKTGKKSGNEVKHSEQMALYALATALRYPHITKIHIELWYPDQDDITIGVYTREQAMKNLARFNKAGLAITECTEWPANPNVYSCRFCRYGAKGSKVCPTGL
jgi:RecB family exonuclease